MRLLFIQGCIRFFTGMKNIIDKMLTVCNLSDQTIREFKTYLSPCHFHKRDLIIIPGTFCKKVYFIERGVTRHYWMFNGDEITTSFSTEGGALFSMDEVYYDKPSEEYIEALEDLDTYYISIKDLNHLYQTNVEIANWGRIIHQNEYRRLHRSHKNLITLSAKNRYEAFLEEFPDVASRINLGYIASYLGITLSTLSRIRGKK